MVNYQERNQLVIFHLFFSFWGRRSKQNNLLCLLLSTLVEDVTLQIYTKFRSNSQREIPHALLKKTFGFNDYGSIYNKHAHNTE